MIRRIYFSLLLVFTLSMTYAQQEAQFTQFMHNKLYLNPAYSGSQGMGSLSVLYRNQWVGFEGSPESKLISFSTPLFHDRVGFGLTVYNQTMGIENTWNASMAYSYNIKLNDESSFRFGLQGSMRYYGVDFGDPSVITLQDGDASIIENQVSDKYTGNFGVGMYMKVKQMYFGASIPQLFPSEIGINTNPQLTRIAEVSPHAYFMAGAMIPISKGIDLQPHILAKYVQGAPFDLDFNISMIFAETFTAGLSYRLGGDDIGDSIDILAMYQINNIGIGAAYDYSLSDIKETTGGSFEVLLRYDFVKERSDMENPRYFFR